MPYVAYYRGEGRKSVCVSHAFHTVSTYLARNASDVYDRATIFDGLHLFFQTMKGADNVYVD